MRREVPLRPIWTIMVAAKLDQSRSLWPSFIKIGQRWRIEVRVRDTHRDRQTDRQTLLKIRALQVCNRANYQNCSVLCCVLYDNAMVRTYIWAAVKDRYWFRFSFSAFV